MSVRTPVESISMRLMIGCVKMLLQPGTCKTRPISSSTRSPFGPVWRGQRKTWSRTAFSSSSRNAMNGSKAAASNVLPKLSLRPLPRRSARLRRRVARRSARPAFGAALTSSSRAYQVKASMPRSNSSQLIFLTRSRQRPCALRSTACRTSPANVLRSAPKRFRDLRHRAAQRRLLAVPERRPRRPATPLSFK